MTLTPVSFALPIILASQSPRRREIFRYFSLPFEQIFHEFDEASYPMGEIPRDYAKGLSLEKAKDVFSRYPENVVVAADTIVVINGLTLSKPKNRSDALQMIHSLSGKWHTVITGVSVISSTGSHSSSAETQVLLNSITEEQIQSYLDRGEWHDKVGGYAIQGVGSLLVNRIDGCYYNVMGLPVGVLSSLLREAGVDLWKFLS